MFYWFGWLADSVLLAALLLCLSRLWGGVTRMRHGYSRFDFGVSLPDFDDNGRDFGISGFGWSTFIFIFHYQ